MDHEQQQGRLSDTRHVPPDERQSSADSADQFRVDADEGCRIPGYSDLDYLAGGALGIVYRARQLGTDRAVAIKLIRPELEMDEKARQLFIREASIISRLRHPRIVECLGFGFVGERPYLVLEYVAAENLEQLVWKHQPARRVRLAVKVVLQILEALIYAHQAGIVHRDIKPSNILARRTRDRLRIKVSDFGLAKMFETAGHSGITGTGELCGTLPYMSPEQLQDSRHARPESDVYAAVVCLYRLLTTEYPYQQRTLLEAARQRLTEDPRPVQPLNPAIPAELAHVIDRGLARDPARRPGSAAQLYAVLQTLPLLNST